MPIKVATDQFSIIHDRASVTNAFARLADTTRDIPTNADYHQGMDAAIAAAALFGTRMEWRGLDLSLRSARIPRDKITPMISYHVNDNPLPEIHAAMLKLNEHARALLKDPQPVLDQLEIAHSSLDAAARHKSMRPTAG